MIWASPLTSRAPCLLGVALVLLSLCFPNRAQADSEAELWLRAGVRYRPVKRLNLDYFQDYRVTENLTQSRRWMNTLAADWSFNKWLDAGGGARVAWHLNEPEACCSFRVHGDVSFKAKASDFSFSWRQRFQARVWESDWRYVFRSRLGAKWRAARHLRPYLNVEPFFRLFEEEPAYSLLRLTLGAEIPLQNWDLKPFYRLEIPREDDPLAQIAGFNLRYTFPRKKKK